MTKTTSSTTSSESNLVAGALRWATHLKLGLEIRQLIPRLRLGKMFEVWSDWKRGIRHPQLSVRPLDDRVHGVTHIRDGRVCGVEISPKDDLKRQLITVVHELIHVFAHPIRPDHRDIHTLAAGLSSVVFPAAEEKNSDMGDLYDLTDEEVVQLTDLADLSDEADEADESIPLTDSSDYDLFRRKKNILSGLKKFLPHQQMSKMLRGRKAKVARHTGIAAPILAKKYGGWIMDYFAEMFRTNAFVIPRRGVSRVTPIDNVWEIVTGSYEGMISSGFSSLDAQPSRTVKGIGQALFGAGPTTVGLTPAVGCLGLIVKVSDSILANNNGSAIITLWPTTPNPLRYKIDFEPTKGTAEFVCFFVENNKGKGLLTARTDLSVRFELAALAATTQITAESINRREIDG